MKVPVFNKNAEKIYVLEVSNPPKPTYWIEGYYGEHECVVHKHLDGSFSALCESYPVNLENK